MYLPNNISLVGVLTPLSGFDLSLHTFLGLSWAVLLPYTLLGVGLMAYSHSRLVSGEHKLFRQDNSTTDRTEVL